MPAVLVIALLAPSAAWAADRGSISYQPPVDAPIVDPFRPPSHTGGAGNRGVDYATEPGAPVKAAADGEVTFAGSVGGRLHVVVLHADGVRTSYSFLESFAVHRGDRVRQGDVVGTSGYQLHFGARVGDDYIDPTTLFDAGPPKVHLVPDALRRPGTEPAERAALVRFLGTVLTKAREQVSDVVEEVRGVTQYARIGNPFLPSRALFRHTLDWWGQRHDCTPASTPPPPLPERRVAVLVGGLGSSGAPLKADIVNVDAPELGYVDTIRFSYAGGAVTDTNTPYAPRETTNDLRVSADRFLALLEQVHRDHPGEAIDIIAHSQGGLVARRALAYGYDPLDPKYPRVANLITLGTPHTGADLATAATMLAKTESGGLIQEGVDAARLMPFDVMGDSIDQMSETSWFLTELNHNALPDGIRFTSIGARGDLLVPALHTRAPGARNTIVKGVPGVIDQHANLPGSDAGRREVALAAAGLPPTCETFTEMMADYYTAAFVSSTEDAFGAALYAGGKYLDRRAGVQDPPVSLPTRRKP
ncbi:MAG: peptidoglycan DD-metalloendopeptidase family protein [Acidimicrobiales bacterium]